MQLVNDASRMLQQVFQKTDWAFCVRHWLEDEIVGEQCWLFRWKSWWVPMVFGFGFRQRNRCRKARQTDSSKFPRRGSSRRHCMVRPGEPMNVRKFHASC